MTSVLTKLALSSYSLKKCDIWNVNEFTINYVFTFSNGGEHLISAHVCFSGDKQNCMNR